MAKDFSVQVGVGHVEKPMKGSGLTRCRRHMILRSLRSAVGQYGRPNRYTRVADV